jgi:hypothetical protein
MDFAPSYPHFDQRIAVKCKKRRDYKLILCNLPALFVGRGIPPNFKPGLSIKVKRVNGLGQG